MDHRSLVQLGRTRLEVTRLGLGTAPLAGLYEPVTEQAAAGVVESALAAGIRLFDTAPLYGYGDAERRLGRALTPGVRDDLVVATKVGRLLHSDQAVFDFSYTGVMRSVEESLERLGLDRVDLLHIHDPDGHFDEALSGAFKALDELRAQGTIGAVGAGMNQAPMLVDLARRATFDCFLLAGRYTLLDQSGLDELLPLCASRGIGVIIGGVYNSGVLADPHHSPRYDYGPAASSVIDRALAFEAVCERHSVPLRAAAIQFPFGHPAVASVLSGARSVAEVEDNVAMVTWPIPDGLWADLRSAGLLPGTVPTP